MIFGKFNSIAVDAQENYITLHFEENAKKNRERAKKNERN
jgi:hypothetical protein